MKRIGFCAALILCCVVFAAAGTPAPAGAARGPAWSMNATIIEACSCPMFCQCYFNTRPAAHHVHGEGEAKHFCRANNAYKVNRGSYGSVKLDGVKFWLSGDLGGDFSGGQLDWGVLTFDKAMTAEQREAVRTIFAHLMPFKWGSLTTAEGDISWIPGKDEARALIDGGKTAEVHLKRFPGMSDDPVVIKNLRYFGARKNDGFLLMPNVVEAYRVGDKAYEFKGTNGFMITFDIDSASVPAAGASSGR